MAITPRNLRMTVDHVADVTRGIQSMTKMRLFVGIPDTQAGRTDAAVSNAVLGYVHEHGMPDRNLPARPFLIPTIQSMQADIAEQMRLAGRAALDGNMGEVRKILTKLGIRAADKIRQKITDGPFEPLKPATVAARLRKTAAGRTRLRALRGQGADLGQWGSENLRPLIDTGQLRRSVTYVIRG